MHFMSHSHCSMDLYGSRAVDTCGLYILWYCLMVSTTFLSYLLLQFNSLTLGALGQNKWFSMFTCGFIIIWHLHLLCPYCTTTPAQLIVTCLVVLLLLYHAGSILVVLPKVHVDCFSFSTVSWYLWHVHHCWPMHSLSHSHCKAGSLWQSWCGHVWFIYHMTLFHGVRCISVILVSLINLHYVQQDYVIDTCGLHCPLASSHGVSDISIFVSFVPPPMYGCFIYLLTLFMYWFVFYFGSITSTS